MIAADKENQRQEVWRRTLNSLQEKVNPHTFSTWFEPIHFLNLEGECITLEVPSKFHQDWIGDNYLDVIREEVSRHHGEKLEVQLKIGEPRPRPSLIATQEPPLPPHRPEASDSGSMPSMNEKYAFNNFVVGPSNQFAYAAALSVSESPASRYNPLFIFGGVGLGKTHLINAIGIHIKQIHSNKRVLYVTSEHFTNEVITSLRYRKQEDLRRRYRSQCDILLIDDIQFIAGKEATQEEFFHTFNTLYESDKQIVVTGDRSPQEIPEMEERIRTRLQSGLIADIGPPELETRVNILKKKAENEELELNDEVALYLAQKIKSNVRELEGALTRLAAYASINHLPPDIETAKKCLSNIIITDKRTLTIDDIQKATAKYFNIKVGDLKAQARHKSVSRPRHICMYLCRSHTNASFHEISDHFGGRDHSTVVQAVKKIKKLMTRDESIKNSIRRIKSELEVITVD